MASIKQLYELQLLDLEIDRRTEALASVESRIGFDEGLREREKALAALRQRIAELESQQRRRQQEADDVRGKMESLERQLYGGSVRNPRELEDLQQEIEMLKRQTRAREDLVLDLMAEVEAARQEEDERTRELQARRAAWEDEQRGLKEGRDALRQELEALRAQREGLVTVFDTVTLEAYQTLRESRQGRAVAKLEQGMCQGCRISLPSHVIRRARSGTELVNCTTCGRILYLS